VKVAIQGELGSNSHAAARLLLGEPQIVGCTVSAEVFDSLTRLRTVDVAVLPIENSLHGSVAEHYDLLLADDVVVLAECRLRIPHMLIVVPGTKFNEIRKVLSHPVALSQCRRFFAEHPELAATPFYDTAGSVKHIIEVGDRSQAAIASEPAAPQYGGEILLRNIEDNPENFTRFFLLARPEDAESLRPAGVPDKMSVAFTIEHRPGSLVEALQRMANENVDLTRIESRPVPGRPWEYVFYVDLRFSVPDAADRILKSLREHCSLVKELGRYQAAK
jgi:prephenate dehydratase